MKRIGMIIMTMIALVFLLGPLALFCKAETLQDRVMTNSAKYLHVREVGNNRGPEIDQWNRYLGLPMGSPYCAAFGIWVYHESGHNLPKIGRCSMLWPRLRANELRYKTFTAEEVRIGAEQVQPADMIIWRSGSNITQNWNGHFGIARGRYFKSSLPTREANTMPSNSGNQREGGGVYDRIRGLGFGSSFQIVGFARVR